VQPSAPSRAMRMDAAHLRARRISSASSAAAADVDHHFALAPPSPRAARRGAALARHRAANAARWLDAREPLPEAGSEPLGERRLDVDAARSVVARRAPPKRCANSLQRGRAGVATLRVLEHARLRLAEDAVAGERAQQPVQRVRVARSSGLPARAVRQRFRHPASTTAASAFHNAPRESPRSVNGARRRPARGSPPPASVSVRQSSRRRLSRTTPMTEACRRGAAASDS
jgi:hypothetical protein